MTPSTTTTTRPPSTLQLVRDPDPAFVAARIDWSSWYLSEEEDLGQSPEQGLILDVLYSSLRVHFRQQGRDERTIGKDNFFQWVRGEPKVQVSPDLYVLPVPPPSPLPRCFRTFEPGHEAPLLAVEIVSTDWRKDYHDKPGEVCDARGRRAGDLRSPRRRP